jgi:hypothetical protein
VPLDRLDKLADPTSWFYLTMASIVGAYFAVKAQVQVRKMD